MTEDSPANATASPIAIAVFDIDGVVRDVGGSYRRALADTVEQFTGQLSSVAYRPTAADVDQLKGEGLWNNDWEASRELIYRHLEQQGMSRAQCPLDYDQLVNFFQSRYRGGSLDPAAWAGYITQEPLLMAPTYLPTLTHHRIAWGFFSGAMRDEAFYVLRRIGVEQPPLVAMEDAPGKPDPTGLMQVVQAISPEPYPVIYAGDTVADMVTITRARAAYPDRQWIAMGILPPHVQTDTAYCDRYAHALTQAGASTVLTSVNALTAQRVQSLIESPPQG